MKSAAEIDGFNGRNRCCRRRDGGGIAPDTPASSGAEGWRGAWLKTGDEQRPMEEKDRR